MKSVRLNAFTDRIDDIRVAGVFHAEITERFPLDQVTAVLCTSLALARTGKLMLQIDSR